MVLLEVVQLHASLKQLVWLQLLMMNYYKKKQMQYQLKLEQNTTLFQNMEIEIFIKV